jgi:hypothetical protein
MAERAGVPFSRMQAAADALLAAELLSKDSFSDSSMTPRHRRFPIGSSAPEDVGN